MEEVVKEVESESSEPSEDEEDCSGSEKGDSLEEALAEAKVTMP